MRYKKSLRDFLMRNSQFAIKEQKIQRIFWNIALSEGYIRTLLQ